MKILTNAIDDRLRHYCREQSDHLWSLNFSLKGKTVKEKNLIKRI